MTDRKLRVVAVECPECGLRAELREKAEGRPKTHFDDVQRHISPCDGNAPAGFPESALVSGPSRAMDRWQGSWSHEILKGARRLVGMVSRVFRQFGRTYFSSHSSCVGSGSALTT
jgi:hypothetical protein